MQLNVGIKRNSINVSSSSSSSHLSNTRRTTKVNQTTNLSPATTPKRSFSALYPTPKPRSTPSVPSSPLAPQPHSSIPSTPNSFTPRTPRTPRSNRTNKNKDGTSIIQSSVKLHDPRDTIQKLELRLDMLDGNPSNEPLRNFDPRLLFEDLGTLESYWMRLPAKNSRDAYINTLMKKFNVQTDDLSQVDLEQLQSHYNAHIHVVSRLAVSMALKNLISNDEVHRETVDRLRKLMHMIHHLFKALFSMAMAHKTADPNHPLDNLTLSPFLEGFDNLDKNPRLIWLLRQRASQMNLRRKNGGVYKEIVTSAGHRTRAWTRIMSMEQFVRLQTDTNDVAIFNLATATRGCKEAAAKELDDGEYQDFPRLVPSRYIHSFKDGIYDVKTHKFYDYVNDPPPRDVTSTKFHSCRFNPKWGEEIPLEITQDLSKEGLFKEVKWITDLIKTPCLDTILESQGLDDSHLDKSYFKSMAIGKMLYKQCEIDNWQFFFVLIGKAATGKSSLGLVIKEFFNFEDVGLISSNQREAFGAQNLHDKHIFLCFELKADFSGIATCDLQSMTSAEPVSLNVKHKDNLMIEHWTATFLFIGNELCEKWHDNAGNFHRRILCGNFTKIVKKQDPELPRKIADEVGAIIVQTNLLFKCWVRRYGNCKIDTTMTPHFVATHKWIKQTLNPIRSFLTSDNRIVLGPQYYLSEGVFWILLKKYMSDFGLPQKVNKNTQQLGDVFEEFGIFVAEKTEQKVFINEDIALCETPSEIKTNQVTAKFYYGLGLRVVATSPFAVGVYGPDATPKDVN